MGTRAFVSFLAILAAGAVVAEDAPPPKTARPAVVYLYGVEALEKLKGTNPAHYARAERIIAAASELCDPGKDRTEFVQFEAKEISCDGMVLKTSNPPKREIGFTLDDTRYVALVTITNAQPRFRRIPGE